MATYSPADSEGLEHNRVAWRGMRPGYEGTLVNAWGELTGTGTTIIYTVPADSVLLVFNSWLAPRSYSLSNTGFLTIYDAAPAEIYRIEGLIFSPSTGGVSSSTHSRFFPLHVIGGYTVRLGELSGGWMQGGFEGILVDVE